MNLTPEQYTKAFELFPGLEAYMNRCSLSNEYRYLSTNEYILNAWQKNRLTELRQHKADNLGEF